MRALLLISVTLVFAIGLVMVYNTSSAAILDRASDASIYQPLIKQIVYAVVGVLFAVGIYCVGYHTLLRLSKPILLFFGVLLLAVFIPGVGRMVNGAHRWIGFAGFSIQPSEFAKIFFVAYFIDAVLRRVSSGEALSGRAFIKILAWMAVPLFLILIEPDHTTVGIIGLTMIALFAIMQIRIRYWALPIAIFLLVGGIAAMNMPYVVERLKVYMDPALDIRGKGHQPHQAKIAAGSGQLTGLGLGESLQKMHYLPEAQNDYIAAIYAEETGFVGITIMVSLYMAIGYAGFTIAMRSVEQQGAYLAAALTLMICLHAFLNLAVVSGLLPSTGKNLPFVSQGGSSLMANIIAVGIILNIAQQQEAVKSVNKKVLSSF